MGVNTWPLRQALTRLPGLRRSDDATRMLSTLQRTGEGIYVEFPGDQVGSAVRKGFRSVRSRVVMEMGGEWVWPFWLDRQLDPRSPAFVPGGQRPVMSNVAFRNWTAVGNVASPSSAIVDPRGMVTPWSDGWSLDWWIGAEDRWHFPSREASVRQRLVGTSPVVETAMRVPGGDAVQRVYAVAGHPDAGDLVVVEVENRSAVPFAVAFAVRPFNPEGIAVVERLALHDRRVMTVDGRPALLLGRPPSAVAGSRLQDGDVSNAIAAGRTQEDLSPVHCSAGMAQAAVVFPLAHTAVMRVAIPMAAGGRSEHGGVIQRRVAALSDVQPGLPSAASVARGWDVQARRGMRLVLPEGRLAEAVDANRKFLLLFHGGGDIMSGPNPTRPFLFRDAAYLVGALDRYGFHDEAAEVLATYPDRQSFDGLFFGQRHDADANGCAIHAIANHWRLTRDSELTSTLGPSIALGARWIQRHRTVGRRRRRHPGIAGLVPGVQPADRTGFSDYSYWDNFWSVAGLRDAAELLTVSGNDFGAGLCRQWTASFRDDVEASLARDRRRLRADAIPSGPGKPIDAAIIGALVACRPLALFAPGHPSIVATVVAIRERFCVGDAFFAAVGQTGLGTHLTLQLAAVELGQGDRRALARLQWMLDVATPTFTWPEAVHPVLGGGCSGDGHHGWAAAEFLTLVRNLLVREVSVPAATESGSPVGLALCSMLPAGWEGHGLEVHDAPTEVGRLSFALRWHGARPALLWQLSPHPGVGRVLITAPGLDRSWSSQELRGETLLTARRETMVGGN